MAGDTVGDAALSDEAVDEEFARLVDQLLPPDPSPGRRLATGTAVFVAVVALAVAWAAGLVVPNPTYGSSSSSGTQLIAVEEPDLVAITGLWFRNTSQASLVLTDVAIDAPGLTLDRLEWYPDDLAPEGETATASEEAGEAMDVAGTPRQMMLREGMTQPLPAEVGSGDSIRVIAYMRVDDCSEAVADPNGRWGTVRGRWEYPDRPSWWHRWESLDSPFQDDSDQWTYNFVTLDGEWIEAAGPLTGACAALRTASEAE